MKKLIYTPDAVEKLRQIDHYLKAEYGDETATAAKNAVRMKIKSLKTMEMQGISVRDMFGFETDYRKIYSSHLHIFYRVEPDAIRIIEIFHEREDFIRKLFPKDKSAETEE